MQTVFFTLRQIAEDHKTGLNDVQFTVKDILLRMEIHFQRKDLVTLRLYFIWQPSFHFSLNRLNTK